MQQKKKKIHFAWWVLFGLAIMMGVARGGINNAASLFLTPVSEDLGVGMGQLTLYLSVSSIAMMVFLPFAGKIRTLIASQGWRTSYIIVGIAAIVIVIPVVLLFIRMSPLQKGLLPYGSDKAEASDSKQDAQTAGNKGVTAAVAKKSLAFYALLFFLFFITAVASFAQFIAPYAQSIGYDVQFAGTVMGVFMFGVLVGSLVFGFLTDKMGAKKTTFFSMFVGLISVFLLIFLPDNPVVFSVAIGLFGFVSSSVGTLGPLLTTAIFGTKEYGAIYGTAALGLALAGITALPAYGFVFDATGSYLYVLYSVAAMILLSVLLIIIAFKGKEKLEEAGHWN